MSRVPDSGRVLLTLSIILMVVRDDSPEAMPSGVLHPVIVAGSHDEMSIPRMGPERVFSASIIRKPSIVLSENDSRHFILLMIDVVKIQNML